MTSENELPVAEPEKRFTAHPILHRTKFTLPAGGVVLACEELIFADENCDIVLAWGLDPIEPPEIGGKVNPAAHTAWPDSDGPSTDAVLHVRRRMVKAAFYKRHEIPPATTPSVELPTSVHGEQSGEK